MKISFPIQIKYPSQYKKLVDFLDNYDFHWIEGQKPSGYTPSVALPFYVGCVERYGQRKLYYRTEEQFKTDPAHYNNNIEVEL